MLIDETPSPVRTASTQAFELIDSIEKGVQQALEAHGEQPPKVAERRGSRRRPYPHPFFLTPLSRASVPDTTSTFSVIGHRLSTGGIDFYHREAIPYRHVVASFPVHDDEWVAFVLHLSWCRFNRFGWYDNGGKFLRMVPSPLQPQSPAEERQLGEVLETISPLNNG